MPQSHAILTTRKAIMKIIANWVTYICTQVIIFGLLAAWEIDGNEHAGNLLQAILWVFVVAGITAPFVSPAKSIQRHGDVRRIIGMANAIALVVLLLWFGHFALAFFYALSLIGIRVYRDQFDAAGNPLPPAPAPIRHES
jgi:hypothetical protein